MLIGYVRPYRGDLNCEYQLENLNKLNCATIITEEHSSDKKRKQLIKMINNIKKGDVIVVAKLFSIADSTRHLVELLEEMDMKGAYFQSLSEGIDTSNPSWSHFTEMVKDLVQFQSDVISENTKEGLYEAKQKGITAGRPRKNDESIHKAIKMYESKKYSLSEIKKETGISKSTLYRYLEH
ncbi:DNA invertase Pin-like site-specific DNA recombinase [Sedimentibacter acidaminivorans]|uniref:DNA invertase Pin-like site-specific DNA recombinase n=1 Tax=Sedimentibacter acidaminivorans TaxID=913099 RepID=A0ABS4GG52_9FIRM|nr:recombinase family protein [Sedimentibacter acidaminivorans]MBP1926675.1 DNA invertase Pin-like site-specific DNA recombinase [Sedimentibacter acidaminivorans]